MKQGAKFVREYGRCDRDTQDPAGHRQECEYRRRLSYDTRLVTPVCLDGNENILVGGT